jgi:hypothetical protein
MLSEYCEYRRLARRIVLIPTNTALRRKAAEGFRYPISDKPRKQRKHQNE